jgi:hypothetical protein
VAEGTRQIWREARRRWIAILAAWAVVVAAIAPPPALAHPAASDVLCLSDGVTPGGDGLPDPAPDDHVHPCCHVGGVSAAMVPPRGPADAAAPADGAAVAVSQPFGLPARPASPECHPQAPRAPPTS